MKVSHHVLYHHNNAKTNNDHVADNGNQNEKSVSGICGTRVSRFQLEPQK